MRKLKMALLIIVVCTVGFFAWAGISVASDILAEGNHTAIAVDLPNKVDYIQEMPYIEGKKTSQPITITNDRDTPTTYSLVVESEVDNIGSLVSFSDKQPTLAAGESRTIQVKFCNPIQHNAMATMSSEVRELPADFDFFVIVREQVDNPLSARVFGIDRSVTYTSAWHIETADVVVVK